MQQKPKVYLIVGHYGSGKTSIVNYYPHDKTEDGVTTRVKGFLSIGGKRGADDFKMYKMTKKAYYKNVFNNNENYLVHGAIFSNRPDLFHYSQSHDITVIILENSFEVLKDRVMKRNPKSNFSIKKYLQFDRKMSYLTAFCMYKGYKIIRVNNDRSLEIVSNEVWTRFLNSPNGAINKG